MESFYQQLKGEENNPWLVVIQHPKLSSCTNTQVHTKFWGHAILGYSKKRVFKYKS